MNSLLDRIRAIQSKKTKSLSSFADEIGINKATFINIMNGTRGLNVDVIIAIANRYTDISAEWFLRGNGEMTSNESTIIQNINKQTNKDSNVVTGNSNSVGNVGMNAEHIQGLMKIIENQQAMIKDLMASKK